MDIFNNKLFEVGEFVNISDNYKNNKLSFIAPSFKNKTNIRSNIKSNVYNQNGSFHEAPDVIYCSDIYPCSYLYLDNPNYIYDLKNKIDYSSSFLVHNGIFLFKNYSYFDFNDSSLDVEEFTDTDILFLTHVEEEKELKLKIKLEMEEEDDYYFKLLQN